MNTNRRRIDGLLRINDVWEWWVITTDKEGNETGYRFMARVGSKDIILYHDGGWRYFFAVRVPFSAERKIVRAKLYDLWIRRGMPA